jgi:hypothetical protein
MKKLLIALVMLSFCSVVTTAEAIDIKSKISIEKQCTFAISTPVVVEYKFASLPSFDFDVCQGYTFLPSLVYFDTLIVQAANVQSITTAYLPYRRCNSPPTLI